MSVASGAMSASATKKAASSAASAQKSAAQIASDTQLKMWEDAQKSFAPFLELGELGVAQLANKVPDWLAQNVAPYFNEMMAFDYSQMPDAANYAFDPVTGQRVANYSPMPAQQNFQATGGMVSGGTTSPVSYAPPWEGGDPSNYGSWQPRQSTQYPTGRLPVGPDGKPITSSQDGTKTVKVPGSTERGIYLNGEWIPENEIPDRYRQMQIENPEYQRVPVNVSGSGDAWEPSAIAGYNYVLPYSVPQMIDNPDYKPLTTRDKKVTLSPTENLFGYSPLGDKAQYSNQPVNLSSNLEAGGVLSPLVPEFQRELNFQFNPNDPSYKIREKMKMEEINAFLAKQGLAGSTAGQSYMQRELDKFRADEEATQYNRALTERNYMTQTDLDKYNALAGRGDTLYNRLYQQNSDLYGRQSSTIANQDAQRLALLAQRYDLGNDVYGKQYGTALDFSKIGAGAASSSGAGSITTGQGIANSQLYAGNAAAQAALAAGQSNAQMWQGVQNMTTQAAGNYLNNRYNNPSYNYYGAGASAAWRPQATNYAGATGSTMGMY